MTADPTSPSDGAPTEQLSRQLARAVEQSPVLILITDLHGNIEYVNPKFTETTGYSAPEVMGKNPRLLKSGSASPDDYQELWATIRAGRKWRGEFQNRKKNGDLYWAAASISAITGTDGEITHFVAVQEDITERKRLESQILRAQRLESVGTLASGLAHDLNNILTPMLVAMPFLRDQVADPEGQQLLTLIEDNVKRGADIIRQVLTFAGGIPGERLPLRPARIVDDVIHLIQETFPKSIQLQNRVSQDPWALSGDATQMHQVLLNLCLNARDSMPGGGLLALTTENVELDERGAAAIPTARPGSYVVFSVADTGTGIAEPILERIFDPFFSTKGQSHGSGLGLSTALGIVRSHSGFIHVSSKVGQGSTFKVFIPALKQAQESSVIRVSDSLPMGRGEWILVVDDESPIRDMTQRILERRGYRVLTAANGAEGRDAFVEHRDKVSLVLTDVMMPIMDGSELAEAVRAIQPEIKIIAMSGLRSGFGQSNLLKRLQEIGVAAFLDKPFTSEELLLALQRVLA